ncbi:nuclear pore complex protein DDB_G0274915 [Episyrphus balteatus]|uniref:nuclear pore complex protein DDB_G0274915 n=1 Tax=Episyrphus balteatus TaxID=286459 RepID=UPI00248572C5|nr:nuclear pore complex protein DDB_G0274915 [Episyrphus balteatus]
MDNSSIRGRYSLSTTNLSSPIAESTCLNGLSSRSKFNWGEGTISSRSRNNSQSIVDQNNSTSKNSNGIPTKVSMSPSSRIDPRTYVDIHSNGLASRIVKYHDNSTRLNRSLSMTNLYNKPGQFPVVHLKKTEQQYKAKKTKNLSMTRIAAPEKSAFHGNTLSSILRSGSIVGLQKSDEEISRENRPILHPPPTENEMAPTRSVLEVLKEISRKRINSDEMDGTELTKKQCKEPEQDSTSNNGQRTQSKRQREITHPSTFNAQISPEQQVIKKRMCNYNNDILSSLSSSMASVNKKKMMDMQSQKRTASDVGGLNGSSTSFSDFEVSRSEKHRCIGNYEMQQPTTTKYTSVTPLPSAPIQNTNELDSNTRGGIVTRRASEPALTNTKPKLTLFNKDYDETPIINNNTYTKEDGELSGIQFVKPKKSSSISSGGTLLMEKTKKSKLALMLSGLKGELDEEDEVDSVIPKDDKQKITEPPVSTQITSVASVSNSTSLFSTPTITSVASSISITSKPTETIKPAIENSGVKTTETTDGLNSFAVTSTTSTVNPIPVLSSTSNTPAQVSLPAITTSVPVLSTTSTASTNPVAGGFSFGLLNTPKTATTSATSGLSLPSSSISQAIASPLTTSAVVSTPISASGTTSISGTKPFAFGAATTQASASATPSFSFGAPTTQSQTISSTKEPSIVSTFGSPLAITKPTDSAPAVFGQSSASLQPTFSFGSLAAAKTTTNTLTTGTASPATTSALTTNLGLQKSAWNASSISAPTNTNSINGIGSFGGENASLLPQPTTTLTSTSSTGGFSFGSASSTEAPKSLFGNVGPANTTSTNSNTTFSFSAAKTPANPTNTISAFTFGAGAPAPTQSPAAVQNTALTFGATAAPAASNVTPQNIFGNTANAKPSNTFAFGASAPSVPTQNSAFSFSSSDKTTAAVPAASNSVGGFAFNNPSVNFTPVAETNKNIFGTVAPAADPKPAFNFGSSTTTNQNTDKPVVFGASTNIFGTPATSGTPQSSAFTFGSSAGEVANQGAAPTNPFGSASTTMGTAAGSNSIFGAPSGVATLPQSSTFNFGASSSNIKPEASKPTGGFVFGSTSSIGSNASKPAVDMNKTFVFGDSNTTIKPALPSATSVFGGGSGTNNGINGTTENKMFSFGTPAAGGINNTFSTARPTVNPAPAFNFGAVAPANAAPTPNGNLFAPPQGQAPTDRVIKKATRRLHKT